MNTLIESPAVSAFTYLTACLVGSVPTPPLPTLATKATRYYSLFNMDTDEE